MRRFGAAPSVIAAVGFTVLWVVVAVSRPGTTFHLAPVVVAAAPPFLASRNRLAAAAGGMAFVTVVALGMGVAGTLAGPSLLPWGGAVVETVVFGAVGAIVGLVASPLAVAETRHEMGQAGRR